MRLLVDLLILVATVLVATAVARHNMGLRERAECEKHLRAIGVALEIYSMDYAGRYRALTHHLPNPRVILNEVRAAAPGIDFDLFDLEYDILPNR